MEAVVIYPGNSEDVQKIIEFAKTNKLEHLLIDEEDRKVLAGRQLTKLSGKNPKAYATMNEIISVVEEVRNENYYGK